MPWHVALDGARERRLGRLQIGTTRRGIGPAYADKATRIGIRVQDLLDPKILRQKLELAVAEKNVWLQRVYELEPFDVEEVVSTQLGFAERLAPYVADTSLLVDRALRAGERVLFEGAQGTLLDLDHGTYPFVTSSSPIAAGAAVSFGIGPNRIDEVLGVAKAYVTRVGEGPFPSEIVGPDHERVQELGHEFGTVTGPRAALRVARPRRAALRGPRERDHVARVDEARRAVGVRRAARLRALPAAGRLGDRGLPGAPERLPSLPTRLRGARRAGSRRSTTSFRTRRARTSRFVEEALGRAGDARRHGRGARARARARLTPDTLLAHGRWGSPTRNRRPG